MRHGAEPADAHVRFGRAVLGADVGDVVGHVGQPHVELEAQRLARVASNVEAIGGNAERCSHAVGLPFASTAAL